MGTPTKHNKSHMKAVMSKNKLYKGMENNSPDWNKKEA